MLSLLFSNACWAPTRRGLCLFLMGLLVGLEVMKVANQYGPRSTRIVSGAYFQPTASWTAAIMESYHGLELHNSTTVSNATRLQSFYNIKAEEEAFVESFAAAANDPSDNISLTSTTTTTDDDNTIHVSPNETRKVAMIHVGKAGGNTVMTAFPRYRCAKQRRNSDRRQACMDRTAKRGASSPLQLQSLLEIHMGNERPVMGLKQFTTLLFVVRNPITRAVSSYSYLHHNNTRSVYAQFQDPLKDNFYKRCFPTLQHLLHTISEILHPSDDTTDTTIPHDPTTSSLDDEALLKNATNYYRVGHAHYCQRLAIFTLKGIHPLLDPVNVHLRDNNQFYYRKSLQAFPHKEVFVVRTEELWEDIQNLDLATGGTGKFPEKGTVANLNTKTKQSRTDPTHQQSRDLCCLLWQDLEAYQMIVNRARNLSYKDKWETMQRVWTTCRMDTSEQEAYGVEDTRVASNSALARQENDNKAINFSWYLWMQKACPELRVTAPTKVAAPL